MATDHQAPEQIEALTKAIGEAQAKADAGDRMYLVRADYLRGQLAAMIAPQINPGPFPANLAPPTTSPPRHAPQSVKLEALNRIAEETKTKAAAQPEKRGSQPFLNQNSKPNFLGGDTQVTVAPCVSQGDPAGASPHAPRPPKRARPKPPSAARKNFTVRMPDDMRAALEAKAATAKTYPSRYVLELIAADLGVPIDEEKLQRSREMQEEIADLTVALNRQGNNINQIAKATNEGKPSPLSRPEISQLLQQHRAAVSAILRLGFAS